MKFSPSERFARTVLIFIIGIAFLTSLNGVGANAPEIKIWTFDRDMEGWRPANWASIEARDGVIEGVSKYDPQLLSPMLNIRAEDYPELLVRIQSDVSGRGEVFFGLPGVPLSDKRKATHTLPAGDAFVNHRIRLAGAPAWRGTIERIRFDPLNAPDAHVRIDFIALLPRRAGMLLNGGSEIMEDGLPLGWTAGPNPQQVRVGNEQDRPHSGRRFLRASAGGWWETEPVDLSFLNDVQVEFFTRAGSSGNPATLKVEARFFGVHGGVIAAQSNSFAASREWTRKTTRFRPPARAAGVRLRFAAETGSVDIDDVVVRLGSPASIVGRETQPPGAPNWHAFWIWHPNVLDQDHVTVFLRRAFTLPDVKLRKAVVQLTADDGYALRVNNVLIHRTFGEYDGWRTPEVLDVAKALHPGRNVVLITAQDEASAQGVIAEFDVIPVSGRPIRIVTDGSWEAAVDAAGPWTQAAVLGQPPCAPWGPLPYRVVRQGGRVAAELQGGPRSTDVPGALDLNLTLSAQEPVSAPVYAEFVLLQNGKILRRGWAPRPFFADGAPAGSRDTVRNWRFALPWTLQRGKAVVRVVLHGAVAQEPAAEFAFDVRNVPRGGEFPKAEVRAENGIVQLLINGERVNPTQALFLRPDPLHMRHADRAGISVWGVELQEAGFYEKGFDFTKVDETLSRYLEQYPDKWLILNILFDTRWHRWWLKQHPEVWVRLENGSPEVGGYRGARAKWPSMSSPVWRRAYAELLRRLIHHLRETPFAPRIIGIQPCAGITAEWFHWGAQSSELVDYSPAGQADFRQWLRRKYGSNAALQQAWGRTDVTPATARVPSTAERTRPRRGIFFDPVSQRNVRDYHRYQHDVVADNIRRLYRVIKKESHGRLLCGTYYGYVMYLPESPGFCQGSGHFSLYRVLASPDANYGIAPTTYSWRVSGSGPCSMTATGAFAVHGKLWWDQADLRTHWSNQAGFGRPSTLRGSIEQLRREAARALAWGTAVQWYDFSNGWIFGDARIADELAFLQQILAHREVSRPLPPSRVLAVVIDEEQMGSFDPFNPPYAYALIHGQMEQLIRSGVPWRAYLFRDLLNDPALLGHRAFLLLNLFELTPDQRRFVRRRLLQNGRVVAFVGPVGISDGRTISASNTAALLGIRLKELPKPTALRAVFEQSLPVEWAQCTGATYGVSKSFQPVVAPQPAPGVVPLAKLPESGELAAVWRQSEDFRLFWSIAPGLPPVALRSLADAAGLPVVSKSGNNFYISAGVIGMHARKNGACTITWPVKAREVVEVFSGRRFKIGVDRRIPFHVTSGQTLLLIADPAPRLKALILPEREDR